MTVFTVLHDEVNQIPVLRVEGEIDLHTCPALSNAIGQVLEKPGSHLILNLDKVSYIDSTGLGVISVAARQLADHDGKVYAVCTQAHIKKVFELSGLQGKNVVLYDSELSISKSL